MGGIDKGSNEIKTTPQIQCIHLRTKRHVEMVRIRGDIEPIQKLTPKTGSSITWLSIHTTRKPKGGQ